LTAPPWALVFFDVDSTLVTIEGIDELAGGNPDVARLTEAAMNGDIPLEQVYGRRLEFIRPTRTAVDALGKRYVASIVAGAAETVDALRSAGVTVHLVTAGIAQAIAPLADRLGIPADRVHAVALQFNEAGKYAGYDTNSPLTRAGGKEIVVREVRHETPGRAAFVGDGASDLDTKQAVDLFIGFGGVVVREKVKEEADVFVTEPDLRYVLKHLHGVTSRTT
jgi:phosphoserine phosphatase